MSAVLSAVDDYGHDRQVAQLRIPPHSIEAESSVLGGLLLDNGDGERVADLLGEAEFYREEKRLVFDGTHTPIALLPGWTTPISYVLPPYWAAIALHGTSTQGAPIEQTLFAMAMMLLFSIIDLFIASRLFKIMLYKARVDAVLDIQ